MASWAPLLAVNRWPVWRRRVHVWGFDVTPTTFDRCLALWLHKLGWMGRDATAQFPRFVRAGMTVLDVGANQGLYALFLARLAGPTGRVFAFEPHPELFAAAQANCIANGMGTISLYPYALGSEPATLRLFGSLLNAGDNRLSTGSASSTQSVSEVLVRRLDDVLPDVDPDFIKIDVQGWELEVLRGMSRTLEKNRPMTIYFELWPKGLRAAKTSAVELLAFLQGHGFRLYHAESPTTSPIDDLAAFVDRYSGERYTDLIATR
jgi:FkbM family methyltransferase